MRTRSLVFEQTTENTSIDNTVVKNRNLTAVKTFFKKNFKTETLLLKTLGYINHK